jgi:mannose-1-phosphate guanylyltransferase
LAERWAVIIAGGRGTRFWPLSRRTRPKQVLSLDGGPTLLERTITRLSPDIPPERVVVVTGPEMAASVRDLVPGSVVLVEPSGRNTAPAIALGAVEVRRRGGAAFAVLPADHVIGDEAAFRGALDLAFGEAAGGALLTLGVRPTRPETGFGWIEVGDGEGASRPVVRFVEKPALAVAESLLAGGRHLWNAGMFVWTVDALVAAFQAFMPGVAAALSDPLARWTEMEATSIDYGVLEKAPNVRVIPVDFGWSDVGSWSALPEVLPAREFGCGVGEVVAVRSTGNVVHAPGSLVALVGVDNLVVVQTPDAVLVARRDDAQSIRQILERLDALGLGHLT